MKVSQVELLYHCPKCDSIEIRIYETGTMERDQLEDGTWDNGDFEAGDYPKDDWVRCLKCDWEGFTSSLKKK